MQYKELLEVALRVKNKYRELEKARMGREWNLSEMTEGFVVDVADLMKLVMAKEGKRMVENVDQKIKEELCDCLWAVMTIAEKCGVDLEKEFVENMDKLEKRVDETLINPQKAD